MWWVVVTICQRGDNTISPTYLLPMINNKRNIRDMALLNSVQCKLYRLEKSMGLSVLFCERIYCKFVDCTDMFEFCRVCNNMFWKQYIQFCIEKGFIADISVYI